METSEVSIPSLNKTAFGFVLIDKYRVVMKQYVLSLLFICFSLSFYAQEMNEKWLDLINAGKNEYKAENYAEALSNFEKASQIIPTDTVAYDYIIDCSYKTHQPEKLFNALEKLKTLNHLKPKYFAYAISAAHAIQKDYQKALRYVKRGKKIFPGNKQILIEEVNVYYQYGDYSTASDKLKNVIQEYPTFNQAYDILIKIHKKHLRNYQKALKYARKAQDKIPGKLEYHRQETDILLRTGQYKEARNKLEKLIDTYPNDPSLYYNLALTYYENENYERSTEICKKAIELDPDFLAAIYNVGSFYYNWALKYTEALGKMSLDQYREQGAEFEKKAIRNFKKAKPYFEQAIELNPDELDAHKSLNTIEVLLNNLKSNRKETLHRKARTSKDSLKSTVNKDRADSIMAAKTKEKKVAENKPDKKAQKTDISRKNQAQKPKNQASELRETSRELSGNVNLLDQQAEITHNNPHPVITDFSFAYPGSGNSLQSGKSGKLHVKIANKGTGTKNVNLVMMEPVINPALNYQRKTPVRELPAGAKAEVSIPVTYMANNPNSPAIEELDVKRKKFRIYVREPKGFNSELVEFSLQFGKANSAINAGLTTNKASRDFVLLMGSEKYENFARSSDCIAKLNTLKKILINTYTFKKSNVYELYNTDMTKSNIRNTLIKINTEMNSSDNLLIYYAGKSYYDANSDMSYWIPANAAKKDTNQYLSTETLFEYINSVTAKHIIVASEGTFPRSYVIPDDAGTFEPDNNEISSRWCLAANAPPETNTHINPNLSFTDYFIKNLKQNKRSELAFSEHLTFVRMIMKDKTDQKPIGGPLDIAGNKGGEYIFRKETNTK